MDVTVMREAMMEKDDGIHKVILTATCFADASEVIDIAIALASYLETNIEAFLLKEEAMLLASQFPFSRVTDLSGTSSRVSWASMQQAFLDDSKDFQRTLSQAAVKCSVNWTFREIEGTTEQMLAEARANRALSLFGFQRLHKSRNGIIVIAPSPSSEMIDLANWLSFRMESHVETLANSDPEDFSAVLKNLQRHSPSLIMVADQIVRDIGIDQLIDAGRCPIIVFSR